MVLTISNEPQFNVVQQEFHTPVATKKKHAAEAIKNPADIYRIQNYILYERNYRNEKMRKRDNLLFIMGINFGLRAGDLLKIQAGHVLSPNGVIKEKITIVEGKTQKPREVYVNEAVKEALKIYFTNNEIDLDDYLFSSCSNNNSQVYYDGIAQKTRTDGSAYKINGGVNTGLDRKSVEKIMKKIIMDELGIPVHASTHCLRKTFAYQVIMNAPHRDRAIEHLQMIFQHSSPLITLRYAGITDDEIRDTYMNLNIGYSKREQESKIIHMDFIRSSGLEVS